VMDRVAVDGHAGGSAIDPLAERDDESAAGLQPAPALQAIRSGSHGRDRRGGRWPRGRRWRVGLDLGDEEAICSSRRRRGSSSSQVAVAKLRSRAVAGTRAR